MDADRLRLLILDMLEDELDEPVVKQGKRIVVGAPGEEGCVVLVTATRVEAPRRRDE